ncbi:MAG: NAD(P)-dependent oxidoreductase [Burkholderiales bacterium]
MSGSTDRPLRAGVIGLGAMGLPMASNLARGGVATFGCDTHPAARERAAKTAGLTLIETPAAMAKQCDVVFTCLPSLAAVRAVYEGDDGLFAAAHAGLITAECSTIDSDMARTIAASMTARGAAHIETLLLGRPEDSAAAQLYFVVSGDRAVAEQVAPLLKHMGRGWRHVGGNGSANTIKILQNGLGYVYAVATAEALALARARGVDVEAFIEVVKEGRGIGASRYFELYAAGVAAARDDGWGRLYIAAKDTDALTRETTAAGLDLPFFAATDAEYHKAVEAGLADAEFTAVSRMLEARNGKRLFGPPD